MRIGLLAAVVATLAFAAPAPAATIAVLDQSDSLSSREVRHATAGVNAQLRQVNPVWGVTVRAIYRRLPPQTWWVMHVRDSDPGGERHGSVLRYHGAVLGYHTIDNGLPVGIVYARDSTAMGFAWSTVLSHEAVEMAGNPLLSNRFFDPIEGALVDRELADQVQEDEYPAPAPYGDVKVSDWVFPTAFDRAASCPCDYLHKLSAPMTVAPGGYMPIFGDRTRR